MKIKILDEADYLITGRLTAEGGPAQDIEVIKSPLGSAPMSGYKCEHGVYIPFTSKHPDRADFCSLCYPYVVQEKNSAAKSEPVAQAEGVDGSAVPAEDSAVAL